MDKILVGERQVEMFLREVKGKNLVSALIKVFILKRIFKFLEVKKNETV